MIVTDFVRKDNVCEFRYYRQKMMYYTVSAFTGEIFIFPIPLEDLGEATLNSREKSILLMRYIRKAIEDGTMGKVIKSL